jgi:hypothetical protein
VDKNKGHKDAKEFFRLLDAQNNEQHGEQDEFDLEALEGWKLVKDRAKAKEISDSNIDKKLEELLAEDKEVSPLPAGDHPEKKRSKTGLYILSIAASLVLLFGLFFMFKGFNKQEDVAENKAATETTGKDLEAPAPPLEEKLKQTNSDESIVSEKGPAYKEDANKPVPVEKEVTKNEAQYFAGSRVKDKENISQAVAEHAELEVTTATTPENNIDFRKNEELKSKAEDSKDAKGKMQEGKKDDIAQNKFLDVDETTDVALSDKSKVKQSEVREENKKMKSRAVFKKQTSNEGIAAGSPPAMNDQKVPVAALDSTVSPKTTTAANGSATLAGPDNVTLTTPGGNTYSWTNTNTGNTAANKTEPQFIGGKTALDAYIKTNLQVPESCTSEEVIVIRFLVDEKGAVSKPKIMSKTGHCPDCEKEAIRFVKAMPPWVAGTQDGKAASSYKTITLSFKK